MNYCKVELPKDKLELKKVLDLAKEKSFNCWVDSKSSLENPQSLCRQKSTMLFDDAFELIQNNHPHNVCMWRDMESLTRGKEKSYWEFSCSNLGTIREENIKGEYYIFIQVEESIGNEIIELFNLKQNWY